MKKIFFAIIVFCTTANLVSSQTQITWTDDFIVNVAPSPTQVANWENFKTLLLSTHPYTKMTISGTFDAVGQECTDPAIVLAFANALRDFTDYMSVSTNGNVWSTCARYGCEVWLNPPSQCDGNNCPGPNAYMIRPGIGNSNWGGVNSNTCGGDTQTMTFTFEYECDPNTPLVDIDAFSSANVCVYSGAVALPNGSPVGGTYTGNGIVGGTFDPATAGVGSHYIVYSYSDIYSCNNSDSTLIVVDACLGTEELNFLTGVDIYPNPTNGLINVSVAKLEGAMNITLASVEGKIVYRATDLNENAHFIDISSVSNGVYFLKIAINNKEKIVKIIKD